MWPKADFGSDWDPTENLRKEHELTRHSPVPFSNMALGGGGGGGFCFSEAPVLSGECWPQDQRGPVRAECQSLGSKRRRSWSSGAWTKGLAGVNLHPPFFFNLLSLSLSLFFFLAIFECFVPNSVVGIRRQQGMSHIRSLLQETQTNEYIRQWQTGRTSLQARQQVTWQRGPELGPETTREN